MSDFAKGILEAQIEAKEKLLESQNGEVTRLLKSIETTNAQLNELSAAFTALGYQRAHRGGQS